MCTWSRRLVTCLAAVVFGVALSAQRLTVQRWTNADGLPQTTVTTLAQGRDGYLWIGTLGGLVRFDGVRFQGFDGHARRSPWPARIRQVACDAQGTLWVASEDRGLLRADGDRLEQVLDGNVRSFALLEDGRVAALTQARLHWFDASGRDVGVDDTFAGGRPDLAHAIGRDLLVVTTAGTFVHRGDGWQAVEFGATEVHPTDVDSDAAGNAWLRLPTAVLRLRRDATTAELAVRLPGSGGMFVFGCGGSAYFDVDGALWRAQSSALDRAEPVGSIDANWRARMVDREGNLWVGSNDGLSMATPSPLVVREQEDLGLASIGPVLATRDGRVLVGSDTGITSIDGGATETVFATDSEVRALAEAPDGALWACHGTRLLRIVDGAAAALQPDACDPELDMLRALCIDEDGVVWVGGTAGLFRVDARGASFAEGAGWQFERCELTHWTTADGLPDDDVLCICRDRAGCLWLGTAAGASRMVDGGFDNHLARDSGPPSRVRAILPSDDGTVLLATYGHGLCVWRPDGPQWWTKADGLPDNHLSSVLAIPGGEVAVSTNRGIAISRYDELTRPGKRGLPWRSHTAAPGRAVVEAQGGHQPAACVAADGSPWFVVLDGVVRYSPGAATTPAAPTARIERITTAEGVATGSPCRLPRGERSFTVDYTAPWFSGEEELQFQYRLLPLDAQWIDAGGLRTATFHNLPPGALELEVRALLPGSREPPEAVSLAVVVPHLWHERLAVRLTALAAVGIGLVLLLRFRAASAARRERELEQLVQRRTSDLNHEIGVRVRAEQALRGHRDQLDERVSARTAQLQEACARLEQETSDRMRLQARLMQAQKMDSLGLLAGGVAHDFNNMLTIINGSAEIGAHVGGDAAAESFDAILKAGRMAAQLTRQLLIFARRQCIEPVEQDVGAVLRESMLLLGASAGQGIEIETDIAPDLWTVWLPEGHLEQLLVNVCVNARDAMSDGGTITIRARNVDLRGKPRTRDDESEVGVDQLVELLVRDTGVGMSEETQELALDPFFTTKRTGTGLGLSTCYGIARQAGGSLGIDSEPGAGTSVRALLPRFAGAVARASGVGPEPRGSASILLLDDQDDVRAALGKMIRAAGHRVYEAASGPEAIRMVGDLSGGIDLLLADVMMPGMSGPEAARRVLEIEPAMRVAFMSGSASAKEQKDLVASGARLLSKPLTMRDLSTLLDDPAARPAL